MHRRRVVIVLALGSLSASCGGAATSSPPAPTPAPNAPALSASPAASVVPPAAAAPAAPVRPPAPGEWATWSHDQKLGYMKAAVMPKLGATFHDFDPATFPNPRCTLCHSAGAAGGTFKMPDPGLPKLPSNHADFEALAAGEPKVFAFMAKTVVPDTAALLGLPAYDPKTNRGFGCFDCHAKK